MKLKQIWLNDMHFSPIEFFLIGFIFLEWF